MNLVTLIIVKLTKYLPDDVVLELELDAAIPYYLVFSASGPKRCISNPSSDFGPSGVAYSSLEIKPQQHF